MTGGRSANFETWLAIQTQPANLLMVDDSEHDRVLFRTMSLRFNCEWIMTEDVDAAIKLAVENQFRLIFIDLKLGDRSGMEVVRELKRRQTGSPLVVVSGAITADVIAEVSRMGFVLLMQKPLEFTNNFFDEMFSAFNIPLKPVKPESPSI